MRYILEFIAAKKGCLAEFENSSPILVPSVGDVVAFPKVQGDFVVIKRGYLYDEDIVKALVVCEPAPELGEPLTRPHH